MEKRDGARFFQAPKWTSIFIFQHVLCLLAVVSGCQTQLHSMTVSQPAIPFQTESVKCVAPRTEDKCRPQRLSHVLRATECFLQTSSFILHHQRHSRFFSFLAKWQTASVNQKAVTPAASARQSSLKFPGSILGSQWLASESVQRSVSGVGRAGTARNRKPHFQSFDFFQEIRMKQKAGNSLSFFYFFYLLQSLQEHIKGISSSHHMLYSFII